MKVSSAHKPSRKIYGLIYFDETQKGTPSWRLQYYESNRLFTLDLRVESDQAVMAAIADAAEFLRCRPENIHVGDSAFAETSTESYRQAPVRLDRVRGTQEARARVYYAVEDVLRPGWYVQFHDADGRLDRLPLWQAGLEDAEAARTEAAWLLGCRPEEIEVGGELLDWPE